MLQVAEIVGGDLDLLDDIALHAEQEVLDADRTRVGERLRARYLA